MRFCKVLLWILFVLYIGWMLYLLLFQRIGWNADTSYSQWIQQSINLVPFRTIREFIRMVRAHTASGSTDYALAMRNLGGNVVLFVPLGVFLSLIPPTKTLPDISAFCYFGDRAGRNDPAVLHARKLRYRRSDLQHIWCSLRIRHLAVCRNHPKQTHTSDRFLLVKNKNRARCRKRSAASVFL